MAWQNPYIKESQENPHIILDEKEIFSYKEKWKRYFGNDSHLILEIGTGMGNFFGNLVGDNPEKNILGIELRYKRLVSTAEKASKSSQKEDHNFVVLKTLGQNIDQIFGVCEVYETYIFFPDPWSEKEKEKKKRIIGYDFLKKLSTITKSGGKFYFKTDHRGYFEDTISIISNITQWEQNICSFNYEEEDFFDMKNITEFEALYRGQKKEICYGIWKKS